MICKYPLLFCGLLFHWRRTEVFNFDEVRSIYFFFFIRCLCFWCHTQCHKSVPYIFFSKSLVVFALVFGPSIHFEFTLAYGVKFLATVFNPCSLPQWSSCMSTLLCLTQGSVALTFYYSRALHARRVLWPGTINSQYKCLSSLPVKRFWAQGFLYLSCGCFGKLFLLLFYLPFPSPSPCSIFF